MCFSLKIGYYSAASVPSHSLSLSSPPSLPHPAPPPRSQVSLASIYP